MSDIWRILESRESIAAADRHLATHLLALDEHAPPMLGPLVALASAQIRAGNVCLPLVDNPLLEPLGLEADPRAIAGSQLVGAPGDRDKPLILDGDRLYLARYHVWERRIVEAIQRLLAAAPPEVDRDRLRRGLADAFPGDERPDWQRVAAAMAVLRRFCIISGGPGTGKTWTLARILGLLRDQPGGKDLRIALAAPTGKAAARMSEAIAEAGVTGLEEARTLHRLIGMRPGRVQPRYRADHPLPVDLLVIDEVSMVDLPMMARTLAALPESARLILLGDRFQLGSVEAGQVMADLCGEGGGAYGETLATAVEDVGAGPLPRADVPQPPMADHLVVLRRSRRFDPERGIGRLARAVNEGDAEGLLTAFDDPAVEQREATPPRLAELLRERVVPRFRALTALDDPIAALAMLARCRVLCALREGPQGMHRINAIVEAALGVESRGLYHGQPVMVTVNDYRQQLFNGDIGLVLRHGDAGGEERLRVFFPDGRGGVRAVLPSRLPPHETVYAMTIHKSQGSEFDEVILVLPEQESPVVTRELLYTGITRARKRLVLCAGENALRDAVARRTRRVSGIQRALWG